ncbi:amino acid-binding protein [Halobaculum sp. D14]|uniref:amino acid-binding protein n=1 Tax=Halobaculum sp. D14 TaxID=3421642 RepID=UPI003EC060D8
MPSESGDAGEDRQDAPTEAAVTESAAAESEAQTDGGATTQTHTIRLELVDEPGELLAALQPIAENGGNLLSVFHERGNLTPRGHIPVEVDLKCPPEQFESILAGLRDRGVNVTRAGAEEYGAEVTVVLVGHLIDTDLSDTLQRLTDCTDATVADLELSAPAGANSEEPSSALIRLRARENRTAEVLESVRSVADDKALNVIEPMEGEA